MTRQTSILYLCSLLVSLSHTSVFAENDDVIVFDNGDQLTGEFNSMQRGVVNLNSYGASTIDLHWDRIAYVRTSRDILVETVTGARFTGAIVQSEQAKQVVVATNKGPVTIANSQVAKMFPIDSGHLKDLKISVSAGYNFANANSIKQANIGANISHRTARHIAKANFSGNASNSANSEASQRRLLGISYSRLMPNRWLTSASLSLDTNDELNISLRSSLGAGGGRILAESDHSFFSLQAGLLLTKEDLANVAEDINSVESYVDVHWDWFKFAEPELDWSSHLRVIPSLTESGRVRGELMRHSPGKSSET